MDPYQKLMAERAAKAKRNRLVFGTVAILVVGIVGFFIVRDRQRKAAAFEKLKVGDRFADLDKNETGSFWDCVVSGQIDVGSFNSVDQIQQRVEGAYFAQQKTFSDYLTNDCVPKIEHARQAVGSFSTDVSPDLKESVDKYLATLPRLQSGIETYAEKIKGRSANKDVDQMIQEVGSAFGQEVTPEGLAFEKFMQCAIPDLDQKKDIQEVLQFMAATCKNESDAVKFMAHAREQCGPLVMNVDKNAKAVPSKTWKTTIKKFWEEDARQLQAWEYCGKHSRKGRKALDLEAFLVASGDYMEARHGVVQAVKDAVAAATGEPAAPDNPAKPAGE